MSTPTPAPGPEGQHDPVGGGAGGQAPAPGWSGRPDQGPGGPNQYGQYGQSGQSGQYGHDGQDAQHGRDGQRAPGPQGGSAPTPPAAGAEQGWGAVPEIPRYGGEPSSSYGQYGAPGEVPTMAAAQPGIIPLRPLTLGEIYDGAFKAIRANPAVMFGLAAVVVAIVTILQGALTWGAYEDLNRLAGEATPTEEDLEELVGALGASIVPSLAGTVLGFVATTILNGVLIHSVSQSVIGRTLPLRELWDLVRPQLLKLLLLTLLVSVAVAAAFAVFLLPGIIGLASGEVGVGALLLLLGALLALVATLFVVVVTVLATPALVLERSGVLTALRRSWRLTLPAFWRVTGIYLLTTILVGIVAAIVTTPLGMLGQLFDSVTVLTVAQLAGSTVAAAVTTPFMAAVVALLYIDIRIRREGLDVELAAAAAEGP